MQHMLWFSGLRGAVAFSCAHTFPNAHDHRTLFATTTIVLIIVSMYVLGALTVPVLTALGIPRDCELKGGLPMPPPADSARAAVAAVGVHVDGRAERAVAFEDAPGLGSAPLPAARAAVAASSSE